MRALTLLLTALLALIAAPLTAQEVPLPEGRILDEAGVLSPLSELQLNGRLNELEAKAAVNLVIMTVASLEGASEQQFAHMMLDRWELASPEAKHSVILLLATTDRSFTVQVRMWVGSREFEGRPDAYWFEKGVLPPSYVDQLKSILTQAVVPHFGKNDWEGGVKAGLKALLASIPQEAAPDDTTSDEEVS